MFRTYDRKIKELILTKDAHANWKVILTDHQTMIARIQHERIIHLLVTTFVGIVVSAFALLTMITRRLDFLIIFVPLLILFLGYLFHYRFLENTTQSWYLLEDQIKKLL